MCIASEKKMRLEAVSLIGDQVLAELTPLVFSCQHEKGEEIRMAPTARLVNLWEAIRNNLMMKTEGMLKVFASLLHTCTTLQAHFT